MGKKLGRGVGNVYVEDSKSGRMVAFAEGDDIPAWAAKQMGDHCFEDVDGSEPADESEPESDDSDEGDESDAESGDA